MPKLNGHKGETMRKLSPRYQRLAERADRDERSVLMGAFFGLLVLIISIVMWLL